MSTPQLIVFAKVPEAGSVKTRLTSLLTPAEAAGLYAAFLKDALLQYTQLGVGVRLYLNPTSVHLPEGLLLEGVSVHTQTGTGLGERMQRAFLETFAAGGQHVVVIGTDHPTLPSAFINHAFEALEAPYSICIGSSEDGGYYLLGMNEFYPVLFEDMTYSHPKVLIETLARAEHTDARLTILPGWYDVDTPATLRRLVCDVEANSELAINTHRVLQPLKEKYPELKAG